MFNLIEQSYEILTPIDREDILKRIEYAARTCYASQDKITENSASKFVENIIMKGHLSVVEHQSITVKIVTDRAMLAELTRHRLCSFSVQSQRYCNYNKKGLVFIKPLWVDVPLGKYKNTSPSEYVTCFRVNGSDIYFDDDIAQHCIFLNNLDFICISYQMLVGDQKLKPEEARDILPNCTATEIVMTANLREWIHILKLRTDKSSHPQMRELMSGLFEELKRELPEIFSDI